MDTNNTLMYFLPQKKQMNTEIFTMTMTMTMTFLMKHLCHGHFCVPSMPITAESKLSLLIAI